MADPSPSCSEPELTPHGLALDCAKVKLSRHPICRGFVRLLPSNASTSPFSPDSGEKVADRPDEGAFGKGRVRGNPPHPALSPKSIAATLRPTVGCSHANDSGERGQYRTVRTAPIRDKQELTKSSTFAQPRLAPCQTLHGCATEKLRCDSFGQCELQGIQIQQSACLVRIRKDDEQIMLTTDAFRLTACRS